MRRLEWRFALGLAALLLAGRAALAADEGATDDSFVGRARAERAAYELLERLQAREERLDARERLLEERRLTQVEALARAEAKMAELDGLRIAVDERLARLESANEAWLGKLAGIYARMPAERAAAVLAELEPELAESILGRMRASRAAAILASMPTRRAAELSRGIARAPVSPDAPVAQRQAGVSGPASAP